MLRFGLDALVRKHHRIGMAKENGNAGSKAAAKAKRASAKAKKTRAAKDAAAVKASLVGRRATPARRPRSSARSTSRRRWNFA